MPDGRPRPRPGMRSGERKEKPLSLLPGAPKGTLFQTLNDAIAGDTLTPHLLQSLSKQLSHSPPEDAAQQLVDAAVEGTSTIRILCVYLLQRVAEPCAQNVRNLCHQVLEQHNLPTVPLPYKEVAITFATALMVVDRMSPIAITSLAQALVNEASLMHNQGMTKAMLPTGDIVAQLRCLVDALLMALERDPRCHPRVRTVVDQLHNLPPVFIPKKLHKLQRLLSPDHAAVAAAAAAALAAAALHPPQTPDALTPCYSSAEQPERECSGDWDSAEVSPTRRAAQPQCSSDMSPDRLSESDTGSGDTSAFPDLTEASTQELEQQTNELQAENAQLQQELENATEAARAWENEKVELDNEVRHLRQVIRQLNQQNSQLCQCISDLAVNLDDAQRSSECHAKGKGMGLHHHHRPAQAAAGAQQYS